MSSETYNKLHLQYRRVGVARFPNVAALHCCETNYATGSDAARHDMHCFARACHRAQCPRPPARLWTPSCDPSGRGGTLSHKYMDEGRSAIVHATALSLPGSRLVVATDATPKRLHIEMTPPHTWPTSGAASGVHGEAGAETLVGGGARASSNVGPMGAATERGVLYTCKTCEGGPDVPDPVSINVTSCIFRKHSYAYHPTLEAARKIHPCRYYDAAYMGAVCALLGDMNVRTQSFGWWCSDVEAYSRRRDDGGAQS